MNTQRIVSLAIASLLFAAAHALPAQAADVADIEIRSAGAEHALSIDLEQLADGQRLQLSTKAGLPAIVSRAGDLLSIEVGGQTHEVGIGHKVEGLWVGKRGEGEVEIVRLGEGNLHTLHEGKQLKIVTLEGDEQETVEEHGERKVVVIKREGEGPIDEAELETLIERAKAEAGAGDEDHAEARVTVTRRITRDAQD